MFARIILCLLALAQPVAAASLQGAAQVIDGDTLDVAGSRVRLYGIDAPEHNQLCTSAEGRKWACGAYAAEELARMVAGGVVCEALDQDRYGRVVARCASAVGEVNALMVAEGAAFAYAKYSSDYIGLEQDAAARGLGLWAGDAMRPEAFRKAESAQELTPAAPTGCTIKGNISGNKYIYHVPGQKFYAKTQINESKGERWFCSPEEAEAAGWRAARS